MTEEWKKFIPAIQDLFVALVVVVSMFLGAPLVTEELVTASADLGNAFESAIKAVGLLSGTFIYVSGVWKRRNVSLTIPLELIEKLKELGLVD